MNKKLVLLTALAMMSYPISGKPQWWVLSINERKKCFYKPCKNMRPNAMDLYCCEECKIKARQYQK